MADILTNYTIGEWVGADPALSEFLSDGTYDLGFKDSTSKKLSPKEMTSLCHGLMKDYPW